MQVILKQDYEKLGKINDIVTVKDGYARNLLIPAGIAVPATEGNKKVVSEAKLTAQKREDKEAKKSRKLAKKIEDVPCTIPVNVKTDEEIFGSVTAQDISDFLKKEGFEIDKAAVELDEPIKKLGVYSVKVKLFNDVYAKLKVWVVKEEKK
jgi:large subunit ribosomal protein L9